jgi:hypothetical protein
MFLSSSSRGLIRVFYSLVVPFENKFFDANSDTLLLVRDSIDTLLQASVSLCMRPTAYPAALGALGATRTLTFQLKSCLERDSKASMASSEVARAWPDHLKALHRSISDLMKSLAKSKRVQSSVDVSYSSFQMLISGSTLFCFFIRIIDCDLDVLSF